MAKKDLTDEELVEELREKGHEQAAVALERSSPASASSQRTCRPRRRRTRSAARVR